MSFTSPHWPTFLGIGVPKAGTTWLYEVLATHPHVWVPPSQREVHFFNRRFDEGLSWYGQFFPSIDESAYRAVGEVTPHYLYCEPERIAALKSTVPSVERLILLLRNPVDRLYSHYWFRRRVENSDVSFRTFIEDRSIVVEWGRYARYVERWLSHFSRDQLLVLTTERDLSSVEQTREALARFLQVDPGSFPEDAGTSAENARHLPRFRTAYACAIAIRRALRRADVQWPATVARALGVKHWFGRREVDQEMDPKIREELCSLYVDDVKRLEQLLGRTFSEWDLVQSETP